MELLGAADTAPFFTHTLLPKILTGRHGDLLLLIASEIEMISGAEEPAIERLIWQLDDEIVVDPEVIVADESDVDIEEGAVIGTADELAFHYV
jgi:hypothetical protein